ncbi:MAG: glutamate-5-semialdehyde dehydrogenase [Planctomycetes bacterium]|nr:glutamate-5-semialdehyde dehydrogenase [Planctomycetota bacterium]
MSESKAIARAAREASRVLASLPTERKNGLLLALADAIDEHGQVVLEANRLDVEAAASGGLAQAKLQRLRLRESSLTQLREGIRQLARLPDPVGVVTEERTVPSGLRVRRVRVPLGVVCMIYEARPAVTIDAFALCFKAGNACILKGGSDAARSNAALAQIAREVLKRHGLPPDAIASISGLGRTELLELLQLDQDIDLVIPRGGESLIRFVCENSRIPVIQHYKGVCHIFVDASADVEKAVSVCVSAKTSAPATCNAAECVLVHSSIAGVVLPRLAAALRSAGVRILAEERAAGVLGLSPSPDDDIFGREFLDKILAIKVVDGVRAAIDHIAHYGSRHTEAILSSDRASIAAFHASIDASCVVTNASTRFNDGFQLGLGAEIGISTSKLHAYGPMGLEELTTRRFEVAGDYQVR